MTRFSEEARLSAQCPGHWHFKVTVFGPGLNLGLNLNNSRSQAHAAGAGAARVGREPGRDPARA